MHKKHTDTECYTCFRNIWIQSYYSIGIVTVYIPNNATVIRNS